MNWPWFMVRFKKPPAKSLLERPHVRRTVISQDSVTPRLAFPRQIGHLARDQDLARCDESVAGQAPLSKVVRAVEDESHTHRFRRID